MVFWLKIGSISRLSFQYIVSENLHPNELNKNYEIEYGFITKKIIYILN